MRRISTPALGALCVLSGAITLILLDALVRRAIQTDATATMLGDSLADAACVIDQLRARAAQGAAADAAEIGGAA